MFLVRDIDRNKSVFFVNQSFSITYNELELYANDIKKIIGNRKVMVLILDNRSIEPLLMYYTCFHNFDVPYVMDGKTQTSLLIKLLEAYNFSYIWCDRKTFDILKDHYSLSIVHSFQDYVLVKTGFEEIQIASDVAILMSTSGSTGDVKSAIITYENLECACVAAAKAYGVQASDKGILSLPICYCFGQVYVLMHFVMGATLCITNKTIFEKEYWEYFENEKITSYFGVPHTFSQLLRIGFFEKDHPALRYLSQGGGKCSKDIDEAFCASPFAKHTILYTTYGQTETVLVSRLSSENLPQKQGSVGLPIEGVTVLTEYDEGDSELIIKGANVSKGYANSYVDLMSEDLNNGIFYTGDIGHIDEDGFIYILGRKSRFSKIAGLRISHDQVERMLKETFPELTVACVGNDKNLCVVYEGETRLDLEKAIQSFIGNAVHLSVYYVKVVASKEMLLLPNGKYDYHRMKELYLK